MPIDIRLTAAPAPADIPLAAHLATLTGGAGADIVAAVQGAETAGLDPYLGGPVADVLAACQATGASGEVTPMAIWPGGQPHRLTFPGLGDGSAADRGRRAPPWAAASPRTG